MGGRSEGKKMRETEKDRERERGREKEKKNARLQLNDGQNPGRRKAHSALRCNKKITHWFTLCP